MNKSTRKQILNTVPSLKAHHTTYKNKHITRYTDPEGYRYTVTTLTGHVLFITRKLSAARYYIDTHKGV